MRSEPIPLARSVRRGQANGTWAAGVRASFFAARRGPGHALCASVMALGVSLGCGGPDRGGEARQAQTEPAAGGATTAVKPAGPPQRGDWLFCQLSADPTSLNPITASDNVARQVMRYIFPRLLVVDLDTLELRPLVARARPEISDDKLTYTFRLREGVTFSDGVPLTAADVVFTMKVLKHPDVRSPHLRNYFESVEDVVADDPLTVRFVLRTPYFRNEVALGSIQTLPAHYYDAEGSLASTTIRELDAVARGEASADTLPEAARGFAKRFNEDFSRSPMGPGAFAVVDPERDVVTGDRIVLRRRADYWAKDDPTLGDAFVDRIVYRVVPDREAALVALKRGDLDTVPLTPVQHRGPQTNRAGFDRQARKQEYPSLSYTYIGWNAKRPLFADARVRRALSHLVDKQSIVDTVLLGLGEPVESPIDISLPEYNRDLEPYAYDPVLARKLLAEAGWTDSDNDGVLDKEIDGVRVPLRFELVSNSGNPVRRSVGLAVIDTLKRAGVDASFRDIDWSIMLGRVKQHDYDAVILGWVVPPTAPDLYQTWHSSQAVIDGSNYAYYKSPRVDALLEAYRVEFDPAKRKEIYDEVQRIIYDDQPYTFLFAPTRVSAWSNRFRDVSWYSGGDTEYGEWWVPQDAQRYVE